MTTGIQNNEETKLEMNATNTKNSKENDESAVTTEDSPSNLSFITILQENIIRTDPSQLEIQLNNAFFSASFEEEKEKTYKEKIITLMKEIKSFFFKALLFRYFFSYDRKISSSFLITFLIINNFYFCLLISIYLKFYELEVFTFLKKLAFLYFFLSIFYIFSEKFLCMAFTDLPDHIMFGFICQTLVFYPVCIFFSLVVSDVDMLFLGLHCMLSANFINRNVCFAGGIVTLNLFMAFICVNILFLYSYFLMFYLLIMSEIPKMVAQRSMLYRLEYLF